MEPVTVTALVTAGALAVLAFLNWRRATDAEARVTLLEEDLRKLQAQAEPEPTREPADPDGRDDRARDEEEEGGEALLAVTAAGPVAAAEAGSSPTPGGSEERSPSPADAEE
ncbi:MAG: hypothetical protein ACFCGT_20190 [Sandaracinaceae bacterium]